ncbi:MAG: fibronectin type III domain-containing protein [bacterium]|nr:fibronectin type III domain-containing protein [bacterium]
MVFTAQTNHLTVFALGSSPDGVAPSAPTSLAQSSGSGTSVGLSWTAPTTNSDLTSLTDLYGYAIYRSTDGTTYSQVNSSAVTSASYTDTSTSAFTSYYYKITAGDDDDTESAYSTAVQMCSTDSVTNGTIDSSCNVTCNSGFEQSGNTCVVNGGSVIIVNGGGGGGGSTPSPTPTVEATEEEEEEEETTEEEQTNAETSNETEEETNVIEEVATEVKEVAQAFANKITQIISEALEIAKADINGLLNRFRFKRDLSKEQVVTKKYVKALIKNAKGFEQKHQHALTNFVAYGTDTTLKLGEGERAGVVNSYKSALGKMPKTDAEWSDVIKIANGRWPSETSEETEANATAAFKKIYKRAPDRSNPHDDAAVVVISYGLRPTDRNLNSEKAAIKSFRAIYGYDPVSAVAWDIVRAIAYSGATR